MPDYENLAKIAAAAASVDNICQLARGRELNPAEQQLLDENLATLADGVDELRKQFPFAEQLDTTFSGLRRVATAAIKGGISGAVRGGFLSPASRIAANTAAGAGFSAGKELADIAQARLEIKDAIAGLEVIYNAAAHAKPINPEQQRILQQNIANIEKGIQTIRENLEPKHAGKRP